jgi:hypothetical protein
MDIFYFLNLSAPADDKLAMEALVAAVFAVTDYS